MTLIGHPVATAEELLPFEIQDWMRRWREKKLTLAQARAEARSVHESISRIRGEAAADAWWQELIKADKRLH